MTPEELGKILHEAGREAVMKNFIVHKETTIKFIEWNDLSPEAKEGRLIQARYLLDRYVIYANRRHRATIRLPYER